MKTVDRGAALLDEVYGPEWDERIDLERLNLSSICNCVLGQLHPRAENGYYRGLRVTGLGHSFPKSSSHGFTYGRHATFEQLTNAWKRLIERRRKARAVA